MVGMRLKLSLLLALLLASGVLAQGLSLEVIEPSRESYQNTELIPFRVKAWEGDLPAQEVEVKVYCAGGFAGELADQGDGIYEKELQASPVNCQGVFEIVAEKERDGLIERAEERIEVELARPVFQVEVLTPARQYAFGENFTLDFGLDYPLKPGQTLYGGITVNDEYHKLFQVEKKAFSVDFSAQETFLMGENPEFMVELEDGFGNRASKEFELEQTGYWLWYLKQNLVPAMIILAFLAYIAWIETKKARLLKKRTGKKR